MKYAVLQPVVPMKLRQEYMVFTCIAYFIVVGFPVLHDVSDNLTEGAKIAIGH